MKRLGAYYTPQSTQFITWSTRSAQVELWLDGTLYPMDPYPVEGYTHTYSVEVPGDHHNQPYFYRIGNMKTRDPYAFMSNDRDESVVIDLSRTNPEQWHSAPPLERPTDSILYEMHIRDFTMDASSGVPDTLKGSFSGFAHRGSTHQGQTTGLDHLIELGVTHVQLMPIFDFATPMYNWGYDPWNYHIPAAPYSSVPSKDGVARIRELKDMINALHQAGLRVIMDVVYNHTYRTSMLEEFDYHCYTGYNDSGCGNGINTDNPMMIRFIQDSLEFWVEEYRIDGFRFDLMGVFHTHAMYVWARHLRERFPDRQLLLYGEPWNGGFADGYEGGKVRYGNMVHLAEVNVGAFAGVLRDAIRGGTDGQQSGFVANWANKGFGSTGSLWDIYDGLRGSLRDVEGPLYEDVWTRKFAVHPSQSINYCSVHDNLCLRDKILHSGFHGAEALRMHRFALTIIFMAQGIPLLHGGDEMCRTKVVDGDWQYAHNSYNAPDIVNAIRWRWKTDYAETFAFVKALTTFRKAHPALRLASQDEVEQYLPYSQMEVQQNTVIVTRIAHPEDPLLLIYQPNAHAVPITLPAGRWEVIWNHQGPTSVGFVAEQAILADACAVSVLQPSQKPLSPQQCPPPKPKSDPKP